MTNQQSQIKTGKEVALTILTSFAGVVFVLEQKSASLLSLTEAVSLLPRARFSYQRLTFLSLSSSSDAIIFAVNLVVLSKGAFVLRGSGNWSEWAHRDLNPGSSPCKGDVITDLDYEPNKKSFSETI